MGTSRAEISEWFDQGVKQGSTHMIVVCDTYDWDDYPVYVSKDEDCRKKAESYNGKDMQRVMEVYSMAVDKESQMAEHRAFHYE